MSTSHLDALESRCLLSATLDASGKLTITGTENRDFIVVRAARDGKLVVDRRTFVPGTSSARPTIQTEHKTFTASAVKSILVNALGGSDVVSVSGAPFHTLSIPSTVNGGAGNDKILGGNAADELNGGDGSDAIYAGGGNDTVNGNAGNDWLAGGRGNDLINGGDGRDRIFGGAGADSLNGNAGNDYINAVDRASTDKVDGGSNDTPTTIKPGDVAIIDKGDTVTNVERVHTAPTPTAHA
jgi:Ca2+-binding RTX toxin-like protein